MNKTIYTFILFLLIPFVAFGQDKIAVSDFALAPKDLTAIQQGTMLADQNGEKCAIIKVKTTEKGFTFDIGSLAVQKVDYNHTAEIWVYIPHGAKKITIAHPQLGEVSYDFPIPIEKGKTYIMKLTTNTVVTSVFDEKHSGRLILNISPKNVTVGLDGRVESISNGVIDENVFYGTHRYVISADRYHTLDDTITIRNEKTVRNVRLKQAWGWLKFDNSTDLTDAHLFVDTVSRGYISSAPVDIASGTHIIRINKPLYRTYEQEIIIKDSTVNTISPALESDYGVVSLNVPDDKASIWIDDQLVGTGSYEGNLGTGQHVVECKRPSHRPTKKMINVLKDSKTSIQLDAPSPIYSLLKINTYGVPVLIDIDNQDVEKSDGAYSNNKILIGSHTVNVHQKGYKTVTFTADLKEGIPFEKDIRLEAIVAVEFTSKPKNSKVIIDGTYIGTTPISNILSSGKHTVEYQHAGYASNNWTRDFKTDNEVFNKNLNRIYYKNNEAYMEGGAQAGTFLAYYGIIGFNIHNVNFEGVYRGGIDKSEDVYLNYSNGSAPTSCSFKVKQYWGGKIGYAIKLGGRWRITPQIGGGSSELSLKANEGDVSYNFVDNTFANYINDDDKATYVVTGCADCKIEFALTRGVSMIVVPEYTMALKKGETYEKLEAVSSKIKGWGTGFNCALGLHFYF